MELITQSSQLSKEFKRLINKYENLSWATAWASAGSDVFNELRSNKEKINKITVGIHFYQTDPDFIKEFINNRKVCFVQQPKGTFHPKVYLFSKDENEWELIIGSANFTAGAFSKNSEASVMISHIDNNSADVYKIALKLINDSFKQGQVFNEIDLENYTRIYDIQKPKIQSLSGQYGTSKDTPKPIHQITITTRTWDEFVKKVYKEKSHPLEKRLRVIEIARELFSKVDHFKELKEDERKFIAGIPNDLKIEGATEWGYFGSMQGAGKFKNKIKSNNEFISKALDQIPLFGDITQHQYDNYLLYFRQALPGNYLATSTRLLSMKRPDIFLCYDSKNNTALCRDFGINKANMTNERYWKEIIMRIQDSEWWRNSNPKNEIEKKIRSARTAFLDSLYYDE